MNDSTIIYDQIIKSYHEEIKTNLTNLKIQLVKHKILLVFLFITIALFIAARIYCYLIKCQAKQKHLYNCMTQN